MAGLATEFNKMSDQLVAQMDQLRSQQVEIDRSVRRIGEAFASGLDRDGLLEIVAETAVSACSADYGLIALTGQGGSEVSDGQADRGAGRRDQGGRAHGEQGRRVRRGHRGRGACARHRRSIRSGTPRARWGS